MIERGFVLLASFLELTPAAFFVEVFGRGEFQALSARELFRAAPDEHDVRGFFQDGASGGDGIFEAGDGGDGSGHQGAAIHDGGVEFVLAAAVEDGSFARVEEGRIFEDADGLLHGVQAGAAFLQDGVAGGEGLAQGLVIGVLQGGGQIPAQDGSRAAVDDQAGLLFSFLRGGTRANDAQHRAHESPAAAFFNEHFGRLPLERRGRR